MITLKLFSIRAISDYFAIGPAFLTLVLISLYATPSFAERYELTYDLNSPQLTFGAQHIERALKAQGHKVKRVPLSKWKARSRVKTIALSTVNNPSLPKSLKTKKLSASKELKPEGFSLRLSQDGKRYLVSGADPAGAMYGALELSELITINQWQPLKPVDQNAYMGMRGTKLNIPLDVRSPSYTDASDAAQNNIAEMWSWDFWQTYLDNLALHRYNFVSLWNLHPFPSMVKVPDYPDIALNDVQRSTIDWQEHYSLDAIGYDDPEILDNVETIKRITIDEKIAFWKKVMRYAKERNIDFYVVTWNIFTNGTGGKYGITIDAENKTTTDYFRKSVKQMILTYPDLKGIGLTTGENMHPYSPLEKEDWAYDTYAKGVLDAVTELPDRKVTFIHRQHFSDPTAIANKFEPVIAHPNIDFIYSFKYAKAHVYSATQQPYHREFVKNIGEQKTIWTLRNDDIFHFRWGAPNFVREFLSNIPYEVSRGYYYGSDQYIWGREFLSLEPKSPREIELQKHWYHWLLWGRLGYNPELKNQRFVDILQAHFPEVKAESLFTAWQEASMIYPITTGFHWGALDFQWYIEASQSRRDQAGTPTGYHDVNHFIRLKPHTESGYASIPDYVQSVLSKTKLNKLSPYKIAEQLLAHSQKALSLIDPLKPVKNKELKQTIEDIRIIANLGKYYGYKIRGATDLALFRKTGNLQHQSQAIKHLTQSAEAWRMYTALARSYYKNPLWTNRVGHVDWIETMEGVAYDVVAAGGTQDLPPMPPTPGGTIYEAESAKFKYGPVHTKLKNYTGDGYLRQSDLKENFIEWQIKVPRSGDYILELRYLMGREHPAKPELVVNDKFIKAFKLIHVGGRTGWLWDRTLVKLKKGKNTVKINQIRGAYLDHLNVIPR